MKYEEFCPRRQASLTAFFVSALAAAILAGACTTKCAHTDVDFTELAGGQVSYILTELNGGQAVDAVTIPRFDGCKGTVTVWFEHSDDPCLRVHEQTHVQQIIADDRWLWKRLDQTFDPAIGY